MFQGAEQILSIQVEFCHFVNKRHDLPPPPPPLSRGAKKKTNVLPGNLDPSNVYFGVIVT